MRLLVTGAAGRVGRALCTQLLPAHDVAGLDQVAAPQVQHLGDVSDERLLVQALAGVDAVLHSAALHAPHVGQWPDAEFERINVQATARLWRLAAAAGVRRFVFTSTTALFGGQGSDEQGAAWLTETSTPEPRSIYHRSKLAAERWLEEAAAQPGAPVLRILRMARCFAEPAPLMAVYRLHRGVDVRDVVRAHAAALDDAGPAVARWIISGRTPFLPEDVVGLWHDAPAVLRQRAPALVAQFAQRGWPLPRRIDRVYDPSAAALGLGWVAQHGPDEVLRQLDADAPEVMPG